MCPVALAYAKKNKFEFWKADGTGEDGKVMLRDMKALPMLPIRPPMGGRDPRREAARVEPAALRTRAAGAQGEARRRVRIQDVGSRRAQIPEI